GTSGAPLPSADCCGAAGGGGAGSGGATFGWPFATEISSSFLRISGLFDDWAPTLIRSFLAASGGGGSGVGRGIGSAGLAARGGAGRGGRGCTGIILRRTSGGGMKTRADRERSFSSGAICFFSGAL